MNFCQEICFHRGWSIHNHLAIYNTVVRCVFINCHFMMFCLCKLMPGDTHYYTIKFYVIFCHVIHYRSSTLICRDRVFLGFRYNTFCKNVINVKKENKNGKWLKKLLDNNDATTITKNTFQVPADSGTKRGTIFLIHRHLIPTPISLNGRWIIYL